MNNVIDFKTGEPTDKHTEKYISVSVTDFNKAIKHALEINYLPALREVAELVRTREEEKRQNLIRWLVILYGVAFWAGFIVARLV